MLISKIGLFLVMVTFPVILAYMLTLKICKSSIQSSQQLLNSCKTRYVFTSLINISTNRAWPIVSSADNWLCPIHNSSSYCVRSEIHSLISMIKTVISTCFFRGISPFLSLCKKKGTKQIQKGLSRRGKPQWKRIRVGLNDFCSLAAGFVHF